MKERKLTKYYSYTPFGFKQFLLKFGSNTHVDATVQTKSNTATVIEGQITHAVVSNQTSRIKKSSFKKETGKCFQRSRRKEVLVSKDQVLPLCLLPVRRARR